MPPVLDVEAIERDSKIAPIPDVVAYLQEHLGGPAVAYLAGLTDTQILKKWREGTKPQGLTKQRLRCAYLATRMLVETFDDETAEAWFFGSSSKLDDEAPARVLRTAHTYDDFRLVIPAVKAFARIPE